MHFLKKRPWITPSRRLPDQAEWRLFGKIKGTPKDSLWNYSTEGAPMKSEKEKPNPKGMNVCMKKRTNSCVKEEMKKIVKMSVCFRWNGAFSFDG